MEMTRSTDSLDSCMSVQNIDESFIYPGKCWLNVSLPEIWIPSNLLSANQSSTLPESTRGIFHKLEKENSSQQIEGFSVYCDSDEEIFQSDSEDEIFFNSSINSCEDVETSQNNLSEKGSRYSSILSVEPNDAQKCSVAQNLCENLKKIGDIEPKFEHVDRVKPNHDLSNDFEFPICNGNVTEVINGEKVTKADNVSGSQISLNEILDTTPDINLKQFTFDYKKKDITELPNEKRKDIEEKRNIKKERKLKKKASKCVAMEVLGGFRSDQMCRDDSMQEDRSQAYFQHVKTTQNGLTGVQLKSTAQFPDLSVEEIKFMKSEKVCKSQEKCSGISIQTVTAILSGPSKNAEEQNEKFKKILPEDEIKTDNIVVENVPRDVSKEDVLELFSQFGEILNFNLTSDGKFSKFYVEMHFSPDIECAWVIECINGSYPFGGSHQPLICYNAAEI